MKRTVKLVGSSIALTVFFYVLAYFLLPPPPPDASMMVLFAAIAICIVTFIRWRFYKALNKEKPPKPPKHVAQLIVLALASSSLVLSVGCTLRLQNHAVEMEMLAPAWTSPFVFARLSATTNPTCIQRATGVALMASYEHEIAGYGLYSYVLLTHYPSDAERPRYLALLKAMVALPTAAGLQQSLEAACVNITYLLVKSSPSDWEQKSIEGRADYLIDNYDYARAAAISATLSQVGNVGPSIVSFLHPINFHEPPRPALISDLSHAQPTLIADYVQVFKDRVAKPQFWAPDVLSQFALGLRNILETMAVGIGMSKDAVTDWIKIAK